jgi:ATP-dependent Clp protease ATP-binding subunit ClpA
MAYDVLTTAGVSYPKAREAVLTALGGGFDADALATIGIDVEAVRRAVDANFGPGALERVVAGQEARRGGLPFTRRAKKVIELSQREAAALKHKYIGTEHILLAILREGNGLAAQVLGRLAPDTDLEHVVRDHLRSAS